MSPRIYKSLSAFRLNENSIAVAKWFLSAAALCRIMGKTDYCAKPLITSCMKSAIITVFSKPHSPVCASLTLSNEQLSAAHRYAQQEGGGFNCGICVDAGWGRRDGIEIKLDPPFQPVGCGAKLTWSCG